MIILSFFDGFITAVPQQQLQVLANPKAALIMTGTAAPEDVLSGKTFYSTSPETKQVGNLKPIQPQLSFNRIKHVQNPIDEPLALTTAVLLAKELRRSRMAKFKVTS